MEGKTVNLKIHLKSLRDWLGKLYEQLLHLKTQTTKWTTEITKTHRKPDKCMKKQQESQYYRIDEILTARNGEKPENTAKSLIDWPSNFLTFSAF